MGLLLTQLQFCHYIQSIKGPLIVFDKVMYYRMAGLLSLR